MPTEIYIDKKYKKMSPTIQLRDIVSQLTQIMYGKSLSTGQNGCLGEAQDFKLKILRQRVPDLHIILHVPSSVWESERLCTQHCHKGKATHFTSKTPLQYYCRNVISHAKSKGVRVELVIE